MTKLTLAPQVLALVTQGMAEPLLRLEQGARVITEAESEEAFIGRDLLHLENILAHAVFTVLRADAENPLLRELGQTSWPMMQSAIGMRNRYLEGIDWAEADLVEIIERTIEERRRADAMDLDQASTMLRDQVAELSILFPALGLSFGYIGNCDLGCGPKYDDRSWKVFTKLATPSCACSDVSWGGVPTGHLGRMAIEADKALEEWCHATEKRLKDGDIRNLVKVAA